MIRPPFDNRLKTTGLLVLVIAGLVSLTAVLATPSQAETGLQDACEYDSYVPPSLDITWEETYTDALDNGSEEDWSGGQLVSVGADGECSLLVSEGASETLDATTVNGTRGVLTGTVDLGSNGSVRLISVGANASEQPASTNGTGELVISNPGPAYSPTVVIEAGTRSESVEAGSQSAEVTLSSGRFFQFAIRQDDGTARIAVWDVDDEWDGEWDHTVENVTTEADWAVGLDGEVFLDGIGVGVIETSAPATATETASGDTSGDDQPGGPDDGLDDGLDRDFEENPDPEEGSNAAGNVFFGLLLGGWGVIEYRYARPLARFEEQIDAIGSTTRASEVEPAEWKVDLTKAVGVLFVLGGLYFLGQGVL